MTVELSGFDDNLEAAMSRRMVDKFAKKLHSESIRVHHKKVHQNKHQLTAKVEGRNAIFRSQHVDRNLYNAITTVFGKIETEMKKAA